MLHKEATGLITAGTIMNLSAASAIAGLTPIEAIFPITGAAWLFPNLLTVADKENSVRDRVVAIAGMAMTTGLLAWGATANLTGDTDLGRSLLISSPFPALISKAIHYGSLFQEPRQQARTQRANLGRRV